MADPKREDDLDPTDDDAARTEGDGGGEDAPTRVSERADADDAPTRVGERRGASAAGRPGWLGPVDEPIEERDVSAYVAEFLGTFLLVFFICVILSVAALLQGDTFIGFGAADFVLIGLLHAFILAMLVYTLGGTSGAHFNPAVSTALAVVRKITPIDALIYILLQLSGGVAGALAAKALLSDEMDAVDAGATVVNEGAISVLGGLAFEAIGTFVLMWAIMGVAVNPRGQRDWAGLVIGGTLGFLVMAIGSLTGAGFNPARSFGPALVDNEFADFWIYVVGPLVGAALAAVAYTALVIAPQHREGDRPIDKLP